MVFKTLTVLHWALALGLLPLDFMSTPLQVIFIANGKKKALSIHEQ